MAISGTMTCESCHAWGPQLTVGEGMRFVRELRRCKRCSGLVDVPIARLADEPFPHWYEQSGRRRCTNPVGYGEADFGELCGGQALAAVSEDELEDGWPTMTCRGCGGVMRFEATALVE